MECTKTCFVIFTGLIMMTAGAVLAMAGWFAPPINEGVIGVRLAGPIVLLIGLVVLVLSCPMCAYKQGKCCHCCYVCCQLFSKKPSSLPHSSTETHGPLILQEIQEAFDRHPTYDVTQGYIIGGSLPKKHHKQDDRNIQVCTLVNEHALQDSPNASPKMYARGYQKVPCHDMADSDHEPRNDLQIRSATSHKPPMTTARIDTTPYSPARSNPGRSSEIYQPSIASDRLIELERGMSQQVITRPQSLKRGGSGRYKAAKGKANSNRPRYAYRTKAKSSSTGRSSSRINSPLSPNTPQPFSQIYHAYV